MSRESENRFFVIMHGQGTPWVLQLEPSRPSECQRAIAWQHRGGNYQPMSICEFDASRDAFVAFETLDEFKPDRGCYKSEVWEAFKAGLLNRASAS